MKASLFKKVALWLLLIITAVEVVMFIGLYIFTYNKAIDNATANVTKAAKLAADRAAFVDPDKFRIESEDENILVSTFANACNQFDIDIVYFLRPDTKDDSVMYLTRGISARQGEQLNTHPVDDMYGSFVEGGMTAEMKKAYEGDDSGITAHVQNDKQDKLVCYVPVKYYGDSTDGEYTKIGAIVSAEISLDRVMADINARFREFSVILLIATITVTVSAAVILYFRVSKPLKFISGRIKGFVSDRSEDFEKLPVKGNDELAEVSDSFNNMAEEIDSYIDEVAEFNRQKAELNIAKSIQIGLLEPPSFSNEKVTISASMNTAKVVGGDLYDYHVLENGSVFVAIGDVSGKGITAALFMSRAITMLRQYAKLGYTPAQMLHEYNLNLVGHNPNMMFITTFIAVYDPEAGTLTYSNAGHNYPFILSDKLIKLDGKGGLAAGVFRVKKYGEHTVSVKPGDRLYLYTDGVTEARDKDGGFFGVEALETLLTEHLSDNAEDLNKAVIDTIERFAEGAEQADDITMLTLQIN